MNFFKTFLTSCLGTVTGLMAFAILGIIILISISRSEEVSEVTEESVLMLRLNGPITELEVEDPFGGFLPEASDASFGLVQVMDAIRHAKEDDQIKGIFLNTGIMMAGYATIEELRDALIDFRSSGKWVIAYADAYSEGAYFLASAADKVYMNPDGIVEFNGLAAEVMFFKRMFDKLEIRPEVFRVGDFKSAVEPFLREDMSPENRLQLDAMLASIHKEMIARMAADRKTTPERLKAIADDMLVRNATLAVEHGLVDSLVYEDQVHAELRERMSLDADERIPFIKYGEYQKSYKPRTGATSEIAVIVADGTIMPGKADNGVVGSTTIIEALRRARKSDKVKAVVLRINSPGGSFNASDAMWREIRLTSEEKPVIASMSDYAASGGYFLAMACDTIVARPTTITGSIGVFSVLFDLSGFLGNKIGITSQEVKTGAVGNMVSMTRPLSALEREIWQKQTDEVYEIFTGKAAEGRGMAKDSIKKIASGRVWTGEQALANGLVDKIGGLSEAVRIAAEMGEAGEDYALRYYPKPRTVIEKLLDQSDREVSAKDPIEKLAGPADKLLLNQWRKIRGYGGVQARMPYEFSIR